MTGIATMSALATSSGNTVITPTATILGSRSTFEVSIGHAACLRQAASLNRSTNPLCIERGAEVLSPRCQILNEKLSSNPLPSLTTMASAVQQYQSRMEHFGAQPPFEREVLDLLLRRLNNTPNGTKIVIAQLQCPPPQQQHLTFEESTGPTAKFIKEFLPLFGPTACLPLVKDSMACRASVQDPRCLPPLGGDIAEIAERLQESYDILLLTLGERRVSVSTVFVFGRVANNIMRRCQLPNTIDLVYNLPHPGYLRFFNGNNVRGKLIIASMATLLAKNHAEIAAMVTKVSSMNAFKRFKSTDLDGIKVAMGMRSGDTGGGDGDNLEVDDNLPMFSPAYWKDPGQVLQSNDLRQYEDHVMQDKPWLSLKQAHFKIFSADHTNLKWLENHVTAWPDAVEGKFEQINESKYLKWHYAVIMVNDPDFDSAVATCRSLKSRSFKEMGDFWMNLFINVLPGLQDKYILECGNHQYIPDQALYHIKGIQDLRDCFANPEAFVTESGPPYIVRCDVCGEEQVRRKWVAGCPMMGYTHVSCGYYHPTDWRLRVTGVRSIGQFNRWLRYPMYYINECLVDE